MNRMMSSAHRPKLRSDVHPRPPEEHRLKTRPDVHPRPPDEDIARDLR